MMDDSDMDFDPRDLGTASSTPTELSDVTPAEDYDAY
jgi:hypothetical protein